MRELINLSERETFKWNEREEKHTLINELYEDKKCHSPHKMASWHDYRKKQSWTIFGSIPNHFHQSSSIILLSNSLIIKPIWNIWISLLITCLNELNFWIYIQFMYKLTTEPKKKNSTRTRTIKLSVFILTWPLC